ncbi:Uncharacterised protein [Neisseria meningitidis]|nr:Uncharacterised protein [Neisseria meningitidis]
MFFSCRNGFLNLPDSLADGFGNGFFCRFDLFRCFFRRFLCFRQHLGNGFLYLFNRTADGFNSRFDLPFDAFR